MKIIQTLLLFALLGICGYTQVPNFGLVIHGGAGSSLAESPKATIAAYQQALQEAVEFGDSLLRDSVPAVEVAERVIMRMEDNSLFNAGKGSVLDENCEVSMDASLMDGKTGKAGAVGSVWHIQNPIQLARLVMDKTPHVLLTGEGAEQFGFSQGLDSLPNSWFIIPDRVWDCEMRLMQEQLKDVISPKGTVGCVVLDVYGNLAAGTSTGGMDGKMAGRLGDSPIIGAGTFAKNSTCAVSCTGKGELFIVHHVAARISDRMELQNLKLKPAVDSTLNELPAWSGGVISINAQGEIVVNYNTPGMHYAWKKSNGEMKVVPATGE